MSDVYFRDLNEIMQEQFKTEWKRRGMFSFLLAVMEDKDIIVGQFTVKMEVVE